VSSVSLESSEFFKRLSCFSFLLKKRSAQREGFTHKGFAGGCDDFEDHQRYQWGADLRFLDWNVYARTEQFFVKRFQHERDQLFLILIDSSLRMDYGTPSKWERLLEIAATFSFLSLSQNIRLKILTRHSHDSGDFRHFRQLPQVFRYLMDLTPSSQGNLPQALQRSLLFKAQHTLLLSDLLEPNLLPSFQTLCQRRHPLALLQILAPEEQNPPWQGLWKLQSKETQESREKRITSAHLKKYQEVLLQYQKQIQQFCKQHRIPFTWGLSQDSLEHWIEKLFKESGFFLS
jgi:uncharacterized protein (DUF58 family)